MWNGMDDGQCGIQGPVCSGQVTTNSETTDQSSAAELARQQQSATSATGLGPQRTVTVELGTEQLEPG